MYENEPLKIQYSLSIDLKLPASRAMYIANNTRGTLRSEKILSKKIDRDI